MRRRSQRRWIAVSQGLALAGPAAAALWNGISLLLPAVAAELPWWLLLLTPLPGLVSWGAALGVPLLLARANKRGNSYRLTWDSPADWRDLRFRQSLRNFIAVSSGLDIIWAWDGHGLGCWLLADDDAVLGRLVADVLPGGSLELDQYPPVGAGVVVLRWQETPPPPAELCREAGVTGVYFRGLDENNAVVALWGEQAAAVARRYARSEADLLPGAGEALLRPPFVGDNPWPELPLFLSSHAEAGLSSVSRLELLAPELRLNGHGGVMLGVDAAGQPVGFGLPELKTLRRLRMYGRLAAEQSLNLALRAIRAGLPVAFVDGEGSAAGWLQRQLVREAASGRVLSCDADRPAQSKFRLNPLWLPADTTSWPAILGGWPGWLRELGVTPAGLGLDAYRHTLVAVLLTALLAARRGLALDPAALLETLDAPDFLALAAGAGGPELFGPELWSWWQQEGRQTHNFDVHLRVGHLRERISQLLDWPEYRMLWRTPYLDLSETVAQRRSLIWRLPDPRRRLRGYVTSQLVALASHLAAQPPEGTPLLIVLHEVPDIESWARRLAAFPTARVVIAARRVEQRPLTGQLVISKLEREDAEQVQAAGVLGEIRASDLRRLPETRLILRRGPHIGTVDVTR